MRKRHRWWHELWIREKLGVEEESLGLARPDLHELEKYRRLLIHLGASGDIEPPVLSATHLPSPQSKAGKRKLGVAPGLEGSIKEYPHWDKVASLMDAGEPCSWAVLGLAGDPISPSFDSGNRECRDLRGKTNLESLVREVGGWTFCWLPTPALPISPALWELLSLLFWAEGITAGSFQTMPPWF